MSKFQDFQGPLQNFQGFPGLESKFSNSRTFQVFKDPCELCTRWLCDPSLCICSGMVQIPTTTEAETGHLLSLYAKRKLVQQQIRDQGVEVTLKDLHNIKAQTTLTHCRTA
ncbi:hypothetical protein LSH36_983g00100 [Paralvinella palmiformis]|uniref:Uncharacterized protein n=1 Tax=Paralvinella palmiformis TaxID=53620 RepID=A0AAD9MQZ1_9ANNE|nr:hypothetical protein LSH36_983g00100 [Paralvinella palmiformis]